MPTFALGAALLLVLILIGNFRVAKIRPAPAPAYGIQQLPPLPPSILAPSRPQPAQVLIPAKPKTAQQSSTQPAFPENPHFSWLDVIAMQAVLKSEAATPPRDELERLARGYFRGTMPTDLRQLYEEALRRRYLPDPRIGWTDVVRVDRWQRVDELINGPRKPSATMPSSSPAADIDGDLPAEVFVKIKVLKARDEFGDMHGIVQRPDGWVVSSVEVEIFPTGHQDNRKTFAARTWARPDEPSNVLHLYVRNVRGEFSAQPNITGFTWTVVGAKGRRSSSSPPDTAQTRANR